MNVIKRNTFFRSVSILVIISFLTLDISWAYPPGASSNNTLAVPTSFQMPSMPELESRLEESIFPDRKSDDRMKLLSGVFYIGKYLLPRSENGEKIKLKRGSLEAFQTAMEGEARISEEVRDAIKGMDLKSVVPIEYLREHEPEKLEAALRAIGFAETYPDEDVVIIPYETRDNKRSLIQVARKAEVSPDELPGYEWVMHDDSNEFIVKVLPLNYEKPKIAQPVVENEPQIKISDTIAEIEVAPEQSDGIKTRETPTWKLRGKISIKAIVLTAILAILQVPLFAADKGISDAGSFFSEIFSVIGKGLFWCVEGLYYFAAAHPVLALLALIYYNLGFFTDDDNKDSDNDDRGESPKGTTLLSINPFAVLGITAGVGMVLSRTRDFAFAHPVITVIAAVITGVVIFRWAWRVFLPASRPFTPLFVKQNSIHAPPEMRRNNILWIILFTVSFLIPNAFSPIFLPLKSVPRFLQKSAYAASSKVTANTIEISPDIFTIQGPELFLDLRWGAVPGIPRSENGVDLTGYVLEITFNKGKRAQVQPYFKNDSWANVYAYPSYPGRNGVLRFDPAKDGRNVDEFKDFTRIFAIGVKVWRGGSPQDIQKIIKNVRLIPVKKNAARIDTISGKVTVSVGISDSVSEPVSSRAASEGVIEIDPGDFRTQGNELFLDYGGDLTGYALEFVFKKGKRPKVQPWFKNNSWANVYAYPSYPGRDGVVRFNPAKDGRNVDGFDNFTNIAAIGCKVWAGGNSGEIKKMLKSVRLIPVKSGIVHGLAGQTILPFSQSVKGVSWDKITSSWVVNIDVPKEWQHGANRFGKVLIDPGMSGYSPGDKILFEVSFDEQFAGNGIWFGLVRIGDSGDSESVSPESGGWTGGFSSGKWMKYSFECPEGNLNNVRLQVRFDCWNTAVKNGTIRVKVRQIPQKDVVAPESAIPQVIKKRTTKPKVIRVVPKQVEGLPEGAIEINPDDFRPQGNELFLDYPADLTDYILEFVFKKGKRAQVQLWFKNNEWENVYSVPLWPDRNGVIRFDSDKDRRSVNQFDDFTRVSAVGCKVWKGGTSQQVKEMLEAVRLVPKKGKGTRGNKPAGTKKIPRVASVPRTVPDGPITMTPYLRSEASLPARNIGPIPIDEFQNMSGVSLYMYYGRDIGGPNGFSSREAALEARFKGFKKEGINVVRLFTFADLRPVRDKSDRLNSGVRFDLDGKPIGFDKTALEDFKALIRAANKADVKIIPVFFDFMLADKVTKEGSAVVGEHPNLLTNQEHKEALLGIFKEFLTKLKIYMLEEGYYDTWLAGEPMNEPEMTRFTGLPPKILSRYTQSFVEDFVALLREVFPDKPISLSAQHKKDLAHWIHLLEQGKGDILQIHWYRGMENSLDEPRGELNIPEDAVVIFGEADPTDVTMVLKKAHKNGYNGVLFWDDSFYRFLNSKQINEYRDWFGKQKWLERVPVRDFKSGAIVVNAAGVGAILSRVKYFMLVHPVITVIAVLIAGIMLFRQSWRILSPERWYFGQIKKKLSGLINDEKDQGIIRNIIDDYTITASERVPGIKGLIYPDFDYVYVHHDDYSKVAALVRNPAKLKREFAARKQKLIKERGKSTNVDPEYLDPIFKELNIVPSFTVDTRKSEEKRKTPRPLNLEVPHIYPGIVDELEKNNLMGLDKTLHLMFIRPGEDSPRSTFNPCDPKAKELIESPIIYETLKKLGHVGPVSLHIGFSGEWDAEKGAVTVEPGAEISEEEMFNRIVDTVNLLKQRMKENGYNNTILLENMDYFPGYKYIWRPDFIRRLLQETGSGLLVDLGHMVITAMAENKDETGEKAQDPLDHLKELVDEETIKVLGEVHVSIPAYMEEENKWVHGGQHNTSMGSFHKKSEGVRITRELLKYILDLRQKTGTNSKLIINFETDDDFAKADVESLAAMLKEWRKGSASVRDIYEMSTDERLSVTRNYTDRHEELDYSIKHVSRVSGIAKRIAEELGVSSDLKNILMAAAEVHDGMYIDPDAYEKIVQYHGGTSFKPGGDNEYTTLEGFLVHITKGKRSELTREEKDMARDLYEHGQRVLEDIKILGIKLPPEVELLIRYHEIPSRFYENLDLYKDKLTINLEEAGLLLTILVTADIVENGNNVDKMGLYRGGRPAETFKQTFSFLEKFFAGQNIKEDRIKQALSRLIAKRDKELLSIIADARHSEELLPGDLEFIKTLDLENALKELIDNNDPGKLADEFKKLTEITMGSHEEAAAKGAILEISRKYAIWTDNLAEKMENAKKLLSDSERINLETLFDEVRQSVKATRDEQWAVVNAGGVGKRFWPVGYEFMPKQLLEFHKGKGTLLQRAVERQIDPDDPNSVDPTHIVIVTTKKLEEKVWEQVEKYGVLKENIIAEPFGLNTGPALRTGALFIEKKAGSDAIVRALNADHIIPDHKAFNQVLARCADFAKLTCVYVEIGVTPGAAPDGSLVVNPELGHLRKGDSPIGEEMFYLLERVEKKKMGSEEATHKYYKELGEGGARWNSGNVVVRVGVLTHMMEELNPEIENIFQKHKDRLGEVGVLDKMYEEIAGNDKYIALQGKPGKSSHDAMLATPATISNNETFDTACAAGLKKENWDDVGNLYEARRVNGIPEADNYVAKGNDNSIEFEEGTAGNTVYATDDGMKIVLHSGVENVIVAYEKDVNSVLVLPRDSFLKAGDFPGIMAKTPSDPRFPYSIGRNVPEECEVKEKLKDANGNVMVSEAMYVSDCENSSFFSNKGLIAAIDLNGYSVIWQKETGEIHIYAESRPDLVDAALATHVKASKASKDIMQITPNEILKDANENIKNHSSRVARIAVRVAQKMKLPPEDIELLEHAVGAHDIAAMEKFKYTTARHDLDNAMHNDKLTADHRTEPVKRDIKRWLDKIAPHYYSSDLLEETKKQVGQTGDYYPVWDMYVKAILGLLRKTGPMELSKEEEIVSNNIYSHGRGSLEKLKERGISYPDELGLLVEYHHDYSQLDEKLTVMILAGGMSQEEADRIRLLESIIIVSDAFEQGNNFERMYGKKEAQYSVDTTPENVKLEEVVESFERTFNGWMRKRFDEMENIKERRPLEVLKTLIGEKDPELFAIIAEARKSTNLMSADVDFMLGMRAEIKSPADMREFEYLRHRVAGKRIMYLATEDIDDFNHDLRYTIVYYDAEGRPVCSGGYDGLDVVFNSEEYKKLESIDYFPKTADETWYMDAYYDEPLKPVLEMERILSANSGKAADRDIEKVLVRIYKDGPRERIAGLVSRYEDGSKNFKINLLKLFAKFDTDYTRMLIRYLLKNETDPAILSLVDNDITIKSGEADKFMPGDMNSIIFEYGKGFYKFKGTLSERFHAVLKYQEENGVPPVLNDGSSYWEGARDRELERSGRQETRLYAIFNKGRDASFRLHPEGKRPPCFLCVSCRDPKDRGIIIDREWEVKANLYPIFKGDHGILIHRDHIEQKLEKGTIKKVLELVREADDYRFFYNGKDAGATTPDHLHIQFFKTFEPFGSVDKKAPVETLIQNANNLGEPIREKSGVTTQLVKNYPTKQKAVTAFLVRGDHNSINVIGEETDSILRILEGENVDYDVLWTREGVFINTLIFPRSNKQLGVRTDAQTKTIKAEKPYLLGMSPDGLKRDKSRVFATIEFIGIFVGVDEKQYEKITYDDVVTMVDQLGVSVGSEKHNSIMKKLTVLELQNDSSSHLDLADEMNIPANPESLNRSGATELFELVESMINNRRTRLVIAGNKLMKFVAGQEGNFLTAALMQRDESTSSIRVRMEETLKAFSLWKRYMRDKELKMDIPSDIELAVKDIEKDLNTLEADSVVAGIIVRARAAKRTGQNLIIGLETDWIPNYSSGDVQHNLLSPLIGDITSLGKTLRSMGLGNVVVVHEGADQLAEELIKEAGEKTDFTNVIVLASNKTINSASFKPLRSTKTTKRAVLAGVDPTEIEKYYKSSDRDLSKELEIRIMEILSITLEFAMGKDVSKLPIVTNYDRELRMITVLLKAEPVNYNEELPLFYKLKRVALQAA